ncbi:Membrane protease subunit [Prochlorococcus sp. SS52]|uniref:Membrane protease subunit, stomatin/prohibitin family n=2 Tax=Prochlorococcaceae TaxID=2881426 RepID=Q7VE64_PROMA|nr:Membrane protease subunit, stomatin/prohibitin family [Prochlorococcus marinus subsp. marinus str. CCMP1375]KGG11537.1 Membrane protease subunit [Prochlorococcus marinus str. LG]KGG35393.1 Membrane protease subunit [Prochlorococcus sp. SS52]
MQLSIRCDKDPKDFLVWKHPENTPGYGSQIIVQETQKAILLNSGELIGTLPPGTYPIESNNIPFIRKLFPGGEQSIPYDVWFITSTTSTDYNWGTSNPVQIFDSKYNLSLPIGAYGSIRLRINDHQSFFRQIVGTAQSFSPKELRSFILPYIQSEITQSISDISQKNDVFRIASSTKLLSHACGERLAYQWKSFGIYAEDFFVEGISIIGDDPSFVEVKNALAKAASIKIKGEAIGNNRETYSLERSFDVLENAADSDGGAAAAFIGAGLGLGAGANLSNVMNQNNLSQKTSNPQSTSPEERLNKLKSLLDQGLITTEDYENKKSQILNDI